MSEAQNTQTVKDAYAAFGSGDVHGILALLDESVEWEGVKGTEGVLPQAGLRKGKGAVAEFFQLLGSTIEFQVFEPQHFVAQGDTVVALGRYKATVTATKKTIDSDWVMVFDFRGDKIVRFREFADSAQAIRAYGGGVGV